MLRDETSTTGSKSKKNSFFPYVSENMTVLEVGCGPGFFIPAMADFVGDSGKVIACDLQEWNA